MLVTTTEYLEFHEQNPPVQEFHLGEAPLFSAIRRHVRALYLAMYQPEEDQRQNETALMLRFEMLKWLTSPSIPHSGLLQECGLADESRTRRQWGIEIAQTVELLRGLIARYAEVGSVLNAEFVRFFLEFVGEYSQNNIRIWCHPRERDLYRDLLGGYVDLGDELFICTLAEYRNTPPIEALVRFGPLRTFGFGSSPEALITSPVYRRLVRFVWAGLEDEAGFANDIVQPAYNYLATMKVVPKRVSGSQGDWIGAVEVVPEDDLAIIVQEAHSGKASSPCVLVEFPDEYGVLMRPGSSVLVFNPDLADLDAISYRHANEIAAGDYLLIHNADADLGEVSVDAGKAPLAALWKKALADLWRRHPHVCIHKLELAGIELRDLYRAVHKWTEMSGTVIRAPRCKKHFEALLTKVLDPDLVPSAVVDGVVIPGWRRAWAEVEETRVSAIQHGTLEHAIVNDQLVSELSSDLSKIRGAVSLDDVYDHRLPPECGLTGGVVFKPVVSLSQDFKAPQDQLWKLLKLSTAEQYRVVDGDEYLCE